MKAAIWMMAFVLASAGAWAQQGEYQDDLYRRRADNRVPQVKTGGLTPAMPVSTQTRIQTTPVTAPPPRVQTGGLTPAAPTATAALDAELTSRELIVTYEEALRRRLLAYKNYREFDDAYWQLMEDYHQMLTLKYDQTLYAVVTFGNDLWVEPRYITAQFDGSDPTAEFMSRAWNAVPTGRQPKTTTATTTTHVSVILLDDPWDWHYGYRWDPYYYPPYYHRPPYDPPGWGGGWNGGWGGGGWIKPGGYGPSRPGGGRPAVSIRPGAPTNPGPGGGGGGRPTYSTGGRAGNGTNVLIRPGNSGNELTNPAAVGSGGTGTGRQQQQPAQARPASTTQSRPSRPSRNTSAPAPNYSSPSRSTDSGNSSGGGGSSSGGVRRR